MYSNNNAHPDTWSGQALIILCQLPYLNAKKYPPYKGGYS